MAVAYAGLAQAEDKTILIGMQCDRTGPTQVVGTSLCPGTHDYIDLINSEGGIDGWKIDASEVDTAYQVPPAIEEYEHAKARGAKIYGEVVGYGLSGDAFHITAPSEDGDGGFRAMQMALKRAGYQPSDIDYVNAHGTSTMADGIELGAVERFLGNAAGKVSMSSTKSAIGHLLGAAGAVEGIATVLALRDGMIPPTRNLDDPDDELSLDVVRIQARKVDITAAVNDSFGFGGHNVAIAFTKY